MNELPTTLVRYELLAALLPLDLSVLETVEKWMNAAETGYWASNFYFPVEDWQYEVANNDTRESYRDWIRAEASLATWSDLE